MRENLCVLPVVAPGTARPRSALAVRGRGRGSARPAPAGGLRLAALVVVATTAALLAACSGSGFTYVTSSSNNAYFKVPESWRVFGTEEVVGSFPDPRTASSYRFITIFDADPSPAIDRDLKTASHPFGIAQIRELTSLERDQFSLRKLRNEVVDLDRIISEDPESIDLLRTPEALTLENGLAGARHVYTVRQEEGAWTVHQIGLVDTQTQRVYFFIIGCKEQCYSGNESIIEEIADSWTIKE